MELSIDVRELGAVGVRSYELKQAEGIEVGLEYECYEEYIIFYLKGFEELEKVEDAVSDILTEYDRIIEENLESYEDEPAGMEKLMEQYQYNRSRL